MNTKTPDALLNAASQATAANELGTMRGEGAFISGIGAKSQDVMNFAQGLIAATAPTLSVAALTGSPEAAGMTALATAVFKSTTVKGWKF